MEKYNAVKATEPVIEELKRKLLSVRSRLGAQTKMVKHYKGVAELKEELKEKLRAEAFSQANQKIDLQNRLDLAYREVESQARINLEKQEQIDAVERKNNDLQKLLKESESEARTYRMRTDVHQRQIDTLRGVINDLNKDVEVLTQNAHDREQLIELQKGYFGEHRQEIDALVIERDTFNRRLGQANIEIIRLTNTIKTITGMWEALEERKGPDA